MIKQERKPDVRKTVRIQAAVFAVAAFFGFSSLAQAAGTLSNTSIDNQASVNYDVLSVPQPQEDSNVESFVVDNKVDLTVQELGSSLTLVAAGGTSQVLTFTVTNDGNTVQDFLLTAVDAALATADPHGGGQTDSFDATNPFAPGEGVFVDNGDSSFNAVDDTATFIDELAPDATVTVFIVRNIPGGQSDNDLAVMSLNAQVAQGGVAATEGAAITTDDSAIADDPATVQIVFADGAGDVDAALDGQHSDSDGYLVGSAVLSVSKSSSVITDGFTVGPNAKPIPGAIVEFTITVTNAPAAAATASNIVVTDSLDTEITSGSLLLDDDAYGTSPSNQGIEVTAPNINGGAPLALTNAADADQGSFATNVVTVSGIVLAPGEQATVKFRIEIQ